MTSLQMAGSFSGDFWNLYSIWQSNTVFYAAITTCCCSLRPASDACVRLISLFRRRPLGCHSGRLSSGRRHAGYGVVSNDCADASAANAAISKSSQAPLPPPKPAQEVSFCRTSEGINLAVAVCGKGLPVVKAANWMNHVEFDWQSPVWSPLLTRLAAQFRLIRYDER